MWKVKMYKVRCFLLLSICACVCLLTGCTVRVDLVVNNLSSQLANVYLKYNDGESRPVTRLIGAVPAGQNHVFPQAGIASELLHAVAVDRNDKPLPFTVARASEKVILEISNATRH